ncbi:uncharacterized protein LOC116117691 [Pistacia vera]|uniref:uncharacterized protein LOC116117691 n=1 Tax=Pistacia vera TaxID=55513 RepID=UPI0012630178|nr:uncharacterized protein LOC116117691 [Pistacia vera]
MTKIAGTLLERENNRGSNQARRLHDKRSSYWDDLPQELLEIISKSLNIVEYRNLGRVCRSWRLFYSEFKQSFLTSHSPLVVHASAQVNKYCYFFDIATGMEYKRKLPRYIWDFKFCLGVSRHQIQFPCMPQPPCIMDYDCDNHGIFASFGSQGQDFLIMILSKYGSSLQFLTCIDKQWKEYHYVNKGWRILDIIVFYGRIYVLNSDSQIGIFNLRCCDLRFLELKSAPYIGVHFDKQVRLVASNDQLFVVDSPELYRIDLSRMSNWIFVARIN